MPKHEVDDEARDENDSKDVSCSVSSVTEWRDTQGRIGVTDIKELHGERERTTGTLAPLAD